MIKYLSTDLFLPLILITIILICSRPLRVLAEVPTLPSGIPCEDIEYDIDAYVEINQKTTVGMEAAVFTPDDILFRKEYGYIDKEKQIRLDQDSVLGWGSISKTLIWVSAMQLWEAGQLDLEADIRQYLPDGYLTNLNYDTPITMMTLMNHQGGFQESYADMYVSDIRDVHPLGEQLQMHQPAQIYKPGTVTSYSNWGSALAAYVIEQISNQSYDDYVMEHIFEPLGMNHTAIRPDLSDREGVLEKRLETKCYTAAGTKRPCSFYHIPLYPCGMCAGTLSDLILYAQALIPVKGHTSPLFQKQSTLEQLLSPSSFIGDSEYARLCHGFLVKYYAVPVISHSGNSYGCSAVMAIDPESGIGTVIMVNQYNESIYTDTMLLLIYGKPALADSIPTPKSSEEKYVMQTRTFLEGPLSILSAFETGHALPDNTLPWSYTERDGIAKFEYAETVDWLIIPPQKYYINTILIILLLISLFHVIIIRGIGGGLKLGIRRLQHKTISMPNTCLSRQIRTAYILIAVWYCNTGIIVYHLFANSPCYYYQWQFALSGILGILMIISLISLCLCAKSDRNAGASKIKFAFILFSLLVSIASIFYWDMYQFWNI